MLLTAGSTTAAAATTMATTTCGGHAGGGGGHCGQDTFRTFCQQTSLHGWQYIVDKPASSCRHFFWATIVILSMVCAGTFLYNNTWVSGSLHN